MIRLIADLGRRNVFRVAAAYLVLGWVALQVVGVIENAAGLPAWADSLALIILVAGFPVSLIIAWAFELSPEGEVQRTAAGDAQATLLPPRMIDFALLAGLVAFTGVVVADRVFAPRPVVVAEADDSTADDVVPGDPADVDAAASIAVLPFQDFSAGGDQAWFADGLAEEILNSLARTPDLLVASRTSSFAYRGGERDIPEIAAALGVDHVLEGSVRRAEGRLRVTAQLIRASDGFHVWSENYDRSTDDAIAIQEDIAIEIARALETVMDPEALVQMTRAGTQSIAAYEAHLEGLAHLGAVQETGDLAEREAAFAAFERARTLDPDFSQAHFMASRRFADELSARGFFNDSTADAYETALSEYLIRLDAAIASADDPNQELFLRSERAMALGRLSSAADYMQRYTRALPLDGFGWMQLAGIEVQRSNAETARRATMIAEDYADNEFSYITNIYNYWAVRDFDEGARLALEAVALYPDNFSIAYQAHRKLLWAGDYTRATELAERMLSLPAIPDFSRNLIIIREACAAGDLPRAEGALAQILDDENPTLGTLWIALRTMNRNNEAEALLAPLDREVAPFPLQDWLTYVYFDPSPFPNLMNLLDREGIERPPAIEIPFACHADR